MVRTETVEEAEILGSLCPEKSHLTRPSQQVSAGSKVEATARQETEPVSPAEEVLRDEPDPAGKEEEKPRWAPVVQVVKGSDNQAAVDRPGQVETTDADLQVREQDLILVVAGLLVEEDEERRLGLVEDPISEELQARVSEPDQSTARQLSAREEPTSKPGTESERPEEASEPGQRDHRTPEILLPVSNPVDLVSEKRSSQDRARLSDLVPASTVMENSSVRVQAESYSPVDQYPRGRALGMEEEEKTVWAPAQV